MVCEKNRSAWGAASFEELHSELARAAKGVKRVVAETDLEAETADLRAARRREYLILDQFVSA